MLLKYKIHYTIVYPSYFLSVPLKVLSKLTGQVFSQALMPTYSLSIVKHRKKSAIFALCGFRKYENGDFRKKIIGFL